MGNRLRLGHLHYSSLRTAPALARSQSTLRFKTHSNEPHTPLSPLIRPGPNSLQFFPTFLPKRFCRVSAMNRTVGAQLTIFYNGSVFSYDGITPTQAQTIILVAAAGASGEKVASILKRPQLLQLMPPAAEFSQPALLPIKPNFISALPDGGQGWRRRPPIRQVLREVPIGREQLPPLGRVRSLPLARANSIKRFLEARKKRLQSKAASNSEKKVDGAKANLDAKPEEWLSLT